MMAVLHEMLAQANAVPQRQRNSVALGGQIRVINQRAAWLEQIARMATKSRRANQYVRSSITHSNV